MSVRELMQAIRDNDDVTRHEEFLDNVLARRNRALLDLYLGSKRKGTDDISFGGGFPYLGSPSLVRRLLDRGLDPNEPDWLGKTCLHACAEHGDRSTATVLLDAGVDIDVRDVEFHGTPLAAAVRSWCSETDPSRAQRKRRMVEFLLKRGAATNLPGDEGWATPLSWAARSSRGDIVQLLKQHGAT
jgi:ankyrin repeat protein